MLRTRMASLRVAASFHLRRLHGPPLWSAFSRTASPSLRVRLLCGPGFCGCHWATALSRRVTRIDEARAEQQAAINEVWRAKLSRSWKIVSPSGPPDWRVRTAHFRRNNRTHAGRAGTDLAAELSCQLASTLT
jgi:hypothetical protein